MTIRIRDSIHGSIELSKEELAFIDHPAFQRLRNIKQLGFADLAFPGATHSRYAHSLGAMHMATRMFDAVFKSGDIAEERRLEMRQVLRAAMLLHDIGHSPFSHALESRMPDGLKHEDYTRALSKRFFGNPSLEDYPPILRQIMSSECDADRMDYLLRDSFYCGVNYGKFDADWLISNLVAEEREGQLYLGIKPKAMLSFEDLLQSRQHMFASVYLHHTPVVFERMLIKYCEEEDFILPHDLDEYIQLDDVSIYMRLRQSSNPWAKRIIERRPDKSLLDKGPQKAIYVPRIG